MGLKGIHRKHNGQSFDYSVKTTNWDRGGQKFKFTSNTLTHSEYDCGDKIENQKPPSADK